MQSKNCSHSTAKKHRFQSHASAQERQLQQIWLLKEPLEIRQKIQVPPKSNRLTSGRYPQMRQDTLRNLSHNALKRLTESSHNAEPSAEEARRRGTKMTAQPSSHERGQRVGVVAQRKTEAAGGDYRKNYQTAVLSSTNPSTNPSATTAKNITSTCRLPLACHSLATPSPLACAKPLYSAHTKLSRGEQVRR